MVAQALDEAADQGAQTAEPIHVVTFQTWPYGAIGDDELLGLHAVKGLTEAVAGTLAERNNLETKRHIDRILGWTRAASSLVAKAAVASAATRASLGLLDGPTLISGFGNGESSGGGAHSAGLEGIRASFQQLVQAAVTVEARDRRRSATYGRFVIFIDDLDRIQPGRAVALLEVLKNFLEVPHCVFVIACDYEVVRQGVRARMNIEADDKVEAFFHKIFQLPFSMPTAQYRIDDMLAAFLLQLHGDDSAWGGNARTRETNLRAMAGRMAPMLQAATGSNPRAFKRFLNVVSLLRLMETESTDDVSARSSQQALFALVALQTGWPRVSNAVAAVVADAATDEDAAAGLAELLQLMADTGTDDTIESEREGKTATASDDHLRGRFPEVGEDLRTPEAQVALAWFASEVIRLFDTSGDQALDASECRPLARWARLMNLTSLHREVPREGTWAHVVALVQQRWPKHGAEFLAMTEALQVAARGTLVEVVRSGDVYTRIQIQGTNRALVSLNPTDLTVRQMLTPQRAAQLGLDPVIGAAATLEAAFAALPGDATRIHARTGGRQVLLERLPLGEWRTVQVAIAAFHLAVSGVTLGALSLGTGASMLATPAGEQRPTTADVTATAARRDETVTTHGLPPSADRDAAPV